MTDEACRLHNWPGGGECPACKEDYAETARSIDAEESVWDGLAKVLGAEWMRDHIDASREGLS